MKTPFTILHLEDNQLDAELIKEILILEKIAFEIINVDNKDDFIKALEKKQIDIILADYSLPSFDGLSALKYVLEKGITIPFILVSAVLGEELAIESLHSGATDYVLKSRLERLVPAIQRAMREVEERQQRKKLEKEISELEEMYQKIAERVRGFLKMDLPSGKFTLVDKFLEELSGYSLKEWYASPNFIQKIIHPNFKDAYFENFSLIQNGIVPKIMEYKIIKKDGEERWWLQFNIGSYNIEQKLVSISIVIIDNTESKESTIKYQNLFENALVGMYRTDIVSGKIIEANENMAKIFGCSSIEEYKRFSSRAFYLNDQTRLNFLKELKEKGILQGYQIKLKKKDDSLICVSLSARIYPKEGYIEGIMIDITEQKKIEEELFERENELEKIFEYTGTATIMVEEDTTISKCNYQLEILSGFKKSEIEGKMKWTQLVHPDDLSKILNYHKTRQVDSSSAPQGYEFRLIDKFNNIIPCFLTVGTIPGTKKSIASVLDISLKVKAEAALKRERNAYEIIAESAIHSKGIVDFCQEVLEGLIKIIGFTSGNIRILNKQTKYLIPLASIGLNEDEKNALIIPIENPNISYLREIIFVPDVRNHTLLKNTLLAKKASSYISWPIFNSKNEFLGSLEFSSSVLKKISDEDQVFFETISGIFSTVLERKLVDEALQEKEKQRQLLANIIENSKEVVLQYDGTDKIFYANAPVEDVFGYTPDELIGKPISIFIPPGQDQMMQKILEKLKTQEKITFETIRKHKNNSLIPVIITLSATMDKETDSVTYNAVIVEISDIKRLEATLRGRSYELEVLNKIISAGYLTRNLTELLDFTLNTILSSLDFHGGAIYFVDDLMEKAQQKVVLGMSKQFTSFAKELLIKEMPFKRLFLEGKTIIINNIITINNQKFNFSDQSLIGLPFFSKQKVIGGLFLNTKEKCTIPEEEQLILEAISHELGTAIAKMLAEEELIDFEKNLESIFKELPNFIILLDAKSSSILKLNTNIQERLGYSIKEVYKKPIQILLNPKGKSQYNNLYSRIIAGEIKSCNLPLLSKIGETIDMTFNFHIIDFSKQNTILAIGR